MAILVTMQCFRCNLEQDTSEFNLNDLSQDCKTCRDITKRCSKCRIRKKCFEFNVDIMGQYGLQSRCKACKKNSRKKYAKQTSGTKHCTKCKIEKEFSEYNTNKDHRDGSTSYCKECAINIKRLNRSVH